MNIPIGLVAIVAGARVLREVRDPSPLRPDALGAALLAGAVGALVGAIVQGPDWGWGDPRVAALFALAAVLGAAVVARSARHPAPVIEPALVRVRAFAAANLAAVLFFIAFAAMLLGSVLFLTRVWEESVLSAGLMLAPGPATAALFAVPGGLLSARIGPRAVGAIGTALFTFGGVWWATRLGDTAHYARDLLPGMIVGGAGVGLVNPALAGAATAGLPPERLATGTAVLSMARQLGSALGVALLVAVLGTGAGGAGAFDDAWALMAVAAGAAGVAFALVGPVRVAAPAAVAAEAAA